MDEQEKTTLTEDMPKVATAPRQTRRAKKGGAVWMAGLVAGIALAGGVAYHFGKIPTFGVLPAKQATSGATAKADASALVATVNGAQITRGELDTKIAEVRGSLPEGAVDQSQDATFELQVLDELINMRLLIAEAEKQNITVTDDEVNKEIAALITKLGGEEAFTTQLVAAGLTREKLQENMHNEMLVRKLLDANTAMKSVTASDEEIKKLYDDAVAQAPEGQEIPPLTEVTEMARGQVIQQKSADIIKAYVESLRAKSDVKVTL